MKDYFANIGGADALEGAAKALEHRAKRLRDLASKRRKTEEMHLHLDRLKTIPERLEHLARQVGPDKAQAELARRMRVLPVTVEYYAKESARELARLAAARRDRLVIQMAAKGYSNADIGARVGVHEKTVSRIITRTYRKA